MGRVRMTYAAYLAALRDVRDELTDLESRRNELIKKAIRCKASTQEEIAAAAGLSRSRVAQIAPARATRAAAAAVATAAEADAPAALQPAPAPAATAVATAPQTAAADDDTAVSATLALALRPVPQLPPGELYLSTTKSERITWKNTARRTAFLDTDTGIFWWQREEHRADLGDRSARAILSALPRGPRGEIQRLYIVGPPPWFPRGQRRADLMEWLHGPLPEGWSVARKGHWPGQKFPTARYSAPWGGDVEIRHIAEWFDYGDYGIRDAANAMNLLWEKIRARFGEGTQILGGPATTGKELWQRTIGKSPIPVLSDEIREWIVSTSGQGRFELFGHHGDTIPAAHEYDCIFAYSAHTWGMGSGDPVRITPTMWEAADPKQRDRWLRGRSRFQARVTVPADWDRPFGLLPAAVTADRSDRWQYPAAPGASWVTTCSGEELALAARHGWAVDIQDGMWQADRAKPLNAWTEKLAQIWDECGALVQFHESPAGRDVPRATAARLARKAARSMLLHTIGSFGAHYRDEIGVLPIDEADRIPEGVDYDVTGDTIQWRRRVALPAGPTSHPEWWATVVARQRVALLHCKTPVPGVFAGALHMDPRTLLAFRADAIWATAPTTWPDAQGTRGMFRPKLVVPHEVPTPRTRDELLALRDIAQEV